jgi:hypothetical protein
MPNLPKPLEHAKYYMLTPYEHKAGKGWLCVCDCGGTTIVDGNKLRRGKVKSCGCFRRTNGSNAVLRAQEKNRVLTKAGQPFGWARYKAMEERRVIRAPFMIGSKTGGSKPCWCCRRPTRGEMICTRCATNEPERPAGQVAERVVSRAKKRSPQQRPYKAKDSVPNGL